MNIKLFKFYYDECYIDFKYRTDSLQIYEKKFKRIYLENLSMNFNLNLEYNDYKNIKQYIFEEDD